jgi:hypothetical protein
VAGPGQEAQPNQYQSPPAQAQQPPAQQQTGPQAPSAVSTFVSSLSQAELFMLGGGVLIVATDLVFVIFGPYSFSAIAWLAGAAAALLVLLRRQASGLGLPYTGLLVALAVVAVAIAARELLRDVIFLGGRLTVVDPMFILGMVGLYAGVALMAYGALTLWRSRTG